MFRLKSLKNFTLHFEQIIENFETLGSRVYLYSALDLEFLLNSPNTCLDDYWWQSKLLFKSL